MDRASNDGPDVLATRTNGQNSTPVFASRLVQRKRIPPRRESKDNVSADPVANGRPASSGSSSDNRPAAGHATRIPRPSPNHQKAMSKPRKSLSLSEAYRMAEQEEDVASGSPSPAPRPQRLKRENADEGGLKKVPGRNSLSFGRARSLEHESGPLRDDDTQSSAGSAASRSLRSETSESDIDQKLMQYEEDQRRIQGAAGGKSGIFSKMGISRRVAETGQELHRKSSNNSLEDNSPSRGPRWWGGRGQSKPPHWMTEIVASAGKTETADLDVADRDVPIPSVEGDEAASPNNSPMKRQAIPVPQSAARSPNKSFAWQADADFTAGDLQISNSPPLTNVAWQNTASLPRPRNNKINEIRQREIEAALQYPDESRGSQSADPDDLGARKDEDDGGQPQNRPVGRTNTKIDEIRAREIESLSRKALATARLDEIRERNSEYRSPSPETSRKSSRDLLTASTPGRGGGGEGDVRGKAALDEDSAKSPDTPITVYQGSPPDKISNLGVSDKEQKRGSQSPSPRGGGGPDPRDDSQDLIRRLSRATSASPPLEGQGRSVSVTTGIDNQVLKGGRDAPGKRKPGESSGTTAEALVGPPAIKAPAESKPSVGFARLRRVSSTDSASTKRSSMAQSDGDPTDRIEAEMKLFAPMEAHSERGSIRAPSPKSDDDSDSDDDGERHGATDDTPRPPKPDPLLQPTPRVVGAYVETPATLKSDSRKSGSELLKPEAQKVALDGRKLAGRSSSLSSLRRSRSVPRNRSPLFNSAKPPSLRDDLMEIQRQHQDEDTMNDFSSLFGDNNMQSAKVQKLVKSEIQHDTDVATGMDHDEVKQLAKMVRGVETALEGTREAKKGIERLEHQVANGGCPHCTDGPATDALTYLHIPLPRLYHRRESKFRLSLLGILLLLFTLWLAMEIPMCYYYCKPRYCGEGQECRWSPDDPSQGYALPIKLDQWVTGGSARILANQWRERLGDTWDDVWDIATGTDITDVDTREMTFEQRRRYRRRLFKRGLLPTPRRPSKEQKSKMDSWRTTRQARERARDAREMGYDIGDGLGDESMGADEKVSRRWL